MLTAILPFDRTATRSTDPTSSAASASLPRSLLLCASADSFTASYSLPLSLRQRNPKSFLIDYNAWFDHLSMVPEAQHAGLMLMSDHSTPVGWRFFNAYGVHAFAWVNAAGEHVFVKVSCQPLARSALALYCLTDTCARLGFPCLQYHWLSEQGTKRFTHDEAIRQSGENPDFAKQDLFEHIEKGGTVEYTLMVQVRSFYYGHLGGLSR